MKEELSNETSKEKLILTATFLNGTEMNALFTDESEKSETRPKTQANSKQETRPKTHANDKQEIRPKAQANSKHENRPKAQVNNKLNEKYTKTGCKSNDQDCLTGLKLGHMKMKTGKLGLRVTQMGM